MYGVVVVSGDEINSTPRNIIIENNDQLPPPYPGRDGVYTAAVWHNIEDVPLTFVVGGGETTVSRDSTEYFNRRLSESTEYGVFHYVRLQSDTGRVVRVKITSVLIGLNNNIYSFVSCSSYLCIYHMQIPCNTVLWECLKMG